MKNFLSIIVCSSLIFICHGQEKNTKRTAIASNPSAAGSESMDSFFRPLKWRNIGPFRGGRSVAVSGVVNNPLVYYMGTTGGGVWKTTDAGNSWRNISDGYFTTGSVGAVAVCESDPNVVFVGMGEHAPRGVMTSYGDGVYKSTDAGQTWKKMGLELTRHISGISIHPNNPDIVYVAAQGALHGPSHERGVYKSIDGGRNWRKVLFVDQNTGCADLSMDMNNPRILYAAMWEHHRLPWEVKSGGKGSGMYKSTDGGETWLKIQKGLPNELGKMGVAVSRANSSKVYAVVESDTEKELGGLFVSEDGGMNWSRISKDHRLVQRAWYYIEVTADPLNENLVYVWNSPGLKSIDGGKTWTNVRGTHGDYHQLWINPKNSQNIVSANDGGAAISYNGGKTWSTQSNQPTAQIYRVNADNLFPYNVYGGQQDNSSVRITSRNVSGFSIGEKDWIASAGGESAFIAFDPDNPQLAMGGSYQGTIELLDHSIREGKPNMVAPIQYQAVQPKDMKYRFNWNAPIVYSPNEPNTFYHAGNVLLKTTNKGMSWEVISPDLTRHDTSKMGISGHPYTNEGAGGENYCTIAYVIESPYEKGVIYTGSDDGLVYLTRDGGKNWTNVTPAGLTETLVNCIEISPHDKATAYIACTRYKMNDFAPSLYKTTDYGKTWTKITNGIPYGAYTRCIREDDVRKGLLYAGTETGFYVSYDGGNKWTHLQLNLPVTPITDLKVHKGNLIASTMGRSFWILDDLSLLRQYNPDNPSKGFQLYQPTDAYRVSGGSAMDNVSDDDEEAPVFSSGTNPVSGISFYYQMPAGKEKTDLRLEILDDKGQLVRSYSNKPDKKFVNYPGGPDSDPLLSVKPGLNRFVWDLRYSTLPGVPTVFIEGSYSGRKAAPGKYTARLKSGTDEKAVSFNILPDPRINASAADYANQQTAQAEVELRIKEIHDGVNRIRVAKKQINELLELLTDTVKYKSIHESGKALVKKINTWEDKLVQNKAQSNDDIINFVNMLSADYIFLKGEMDVNIPQVTEGSKKQLANLNSIWQPLKNEYDNISGKMIPDFNAACRNAGIEKVTLPAEEQ